jgi:regulator of sigma E protease
MTFFDYVGPFLLLLGVLVVVHELGHFLVAKWFDVKVERFSVGFGPSIVRRQLGETEYVIAWLPLGGYVKMAGESPDEELAPEDLARSFNAQSPMRRIAIALAGPGMNLLLSVLVVAGLYMSGFPTPTSRIGTVLPDSAADQAGLQPGDRVVGVDGEEIWRWQELTEAVRASGGSAMALAVERGDETIELQVVPERDPDRGTLRIGVTPGLAVAMIAVPDADTPAGRAGLATGDRIVELDGTALRGWYELERGLPKQKGDLELTIERALGDDTETVRLTVPAADPGASWSLESLGAVRVDSSVFLLAFAQPAKRAGFEVGDVMLEANGARIESFEQFAKDVRTGGGAPLSVLVLRRGEKLLIDVVPAAVTEKVDGEVMQIHRIGLSGGPPIEVGELVDEVVLNPIRALWLGTVRTASIFGLIVDGVRMLVTREVGVENLAGPIGIGEIAGDSFAQEGWFPFLWMMCVISVNLAILNLLPIPILDGGHILFATAEMVRGGPVGTKAREVAQTVGISLVILLMGFAFWNDISRNWAGIVGFLKGLI